MSVSSLATVFSRFHAATKQTSAIVAMSLCTACFTVAPRAQEEKATPIPDKEAKVLVREFQQTMKTAKKSLGARVRAVRELGEYENGMFVKPLLQVARTDKSKTVRQEAVKAIGVQPRKKARPALNSLIKKADIHGEPGFTAAIVRSINKSCYTTQDWRRFEKLFAKSLTNPSAVDAHRAILEVAGRQKEIQAVDFLVQHLDEPVPAWVDDPSNPPQEYWEARYKNWQKWQSRVTESLYQITGQRFGSAKEARVWLRKNRKKLKSAKKK